MMVTQTKDPMSLSSTELEKSLYQAPYPISEPTLREPVRRRE